MKKQSILVAFLGLMTFSTSIPLKDVSVDREGKVWEGIKNILTNKYHIDEYKAMCMVAGFEKKTFIHKIVLEEIKDHELHGGKLDSLLQNHYYIEEKRCVDPQTPEELLTFKKPSVDIEDKSVGRSIKPWTSLVVVVFASVSIFLQFCLGTFCSSVCAT